MADLWRTLGYHEVAGAIARGLTESDAICVLEGPPGVGKSWLSRGIGALWEAQGGSSVVAEGDFARSDYSYYPITFAMSSLGGTWRKVSPAIGSVTKATESLVGTSGVLTAAVQALAKLRRLRQGPLVLLDDREQDALHELERLGRTKPVLLIADNLHWWDAKSLLFLRSLTEPRMVNSFPFLRQMRILAVQTPEPYQSVCHPQEHSALLAPHRLAVFTLDRIPRTLFPSVLKALDAGDDLDPDVANAIFALSGGHLAVASRAAARLRSGATDTFLLAGRSDNFLRSLLMERFDSLGPTGSQVARLLQIGAVLGLAFRRDELMCVSQLPDTELSHLLRYCRDEQLLDISGSTASFVHDLYRDYFLNVERGDIVAIHERLVDCLRLLRPADYDVRCINALRAEREDEAQTLAVLAVLQRQRDGQPQDDLPEELLASIAPGRLETVVGRFTIARRQLVEVELAGSLATLDSLPRDLPRPLLAEADYLRALCLMSTRSESDRAHGRALLNTWTGYEVDEPELGLRLSRLHLYGLVHTADKDTARALEGRIRQALTARTAFDASAIDDLYVMDRSAGSLYQPDIAVIRNQEAVAHFGPQPDQSIVRRPVEYYRCLVNYGANLIGTARYADARQVYEDLERLLAAYPRGTFPRVEYAFMNAVLADYRLSRIDAAEAARKQRDIAESLSAGTDPFFVYNALAVYSALTGGFAEAIALFDNIERELLARVIEPEPFMVYLIQANRCIARFLHGSDCLQEWRSLESLVRSVNYVTRPILIRRHELLGLTIAAGNRLESAVAFDEHLTNGPLEFGPLWHNYGHAFRLPEVEFWREN